MKLSYKKLLLLLLYAPEEEKGKPNIAISGRTRLMKMCFLFREELLEDFRKDKIFDEIDLPEFFAWKYGPFLTDVLNDLEFLINQEYIEVTSGENYPLPEELSEYEYWKDDLVTFKSQEYTEEIFSISANKGMDKARDIWNRLSVNQQRLLINFKRPLNRAPLNRILEYVYKKYKDNYTDKSLIRERYLD